MNGKAMTQDLKSAVSEGRGEKTLKMFVTRKKQQPSSKTIPSRKKRIKLNSVANLTAIKTPKFKEMDMNNWDSTTYTWFNVIVSAILGLVIFNFLSTGWTIRLPFGPDLCALAAIFTSMGVWFVLRRMKEKAFPKEQAIPQAMSSYPAIPKNQ